MFPIIYRMIYPGLLVFVVFSLITINYFIGFHKKKKKSCFRDGIITLCVALFGLGLLIYYSGDLLNKDFVVTKGKLIESTRNNDVQKLKFLVDGEITTVYILNSEYAELSPKIDEYFEFTYAPRTDMILLIERN